MERKKQPDKSPEKPRDEIHHKVEHDEELPEKNPSSEEDLDVISEDEEIIEKPSTYEPPPPGEGP